MEKSNGKRRALLALAAVLLGTVLGLGAAALLNRFSAAAPMSRAADAALFRLELADTAQRFEALHLRDEQQRRQARLEQLGSRRDDYLADFSQELLILVNPWNEVPEDYQPRLSQVEEGYLVDRRCAQALAQMLADCREAGNLPLICSAYRTQEYQEELFRNKVLRVLATGVMPSEASAVAARSVAVPGTSEHQLGLAVDIIDEKYVNLDRWQEYTSVQQWLMANCWRYGFILRYPNDKSDVTGIIYEPWHYRYVGVETAKAISETTLCFEEYLLSLSQMPTENT